MRISFVLAAAASILTFAGVASAADIPSSITQPPAGPGTEQPYGPKREAVREGLQADANLGTGFSSTYGLGVDGRIGYALSNGIYLGGEVSYFAGQSIGDQSSHAAFLGGEIGYKIFPTDDRRWEIRPYVFTGPAFVTTVTSPTLSESKTSFALQPGIVGAYHFGDMFLQADARYLLAPSPTTLAVFVGAGLAF